MRVVGGDNADAQGLDSRKAALRRRLFGSARGGARIGGSVGNGNNRLDSGRKNHGKTDVSDHRLAVCARAETGRIALENYSYNEQSRQSRTHDLTHPRGAHRPSPHFSPVAPMIAEDFGSVRTRSLERALATESIAGTTVEVARAPTRFSARTGPKDRCEGAAQARHSRGQRSLQSLKPIDNLCNHRICRGFGHGIKRSGEKCGLVVEHTCNDVSVVAGVFLARRGREVVPGYVERAQRGEGRTGDHPKGAPTKRAECAAHLPCCRVSTYARYAFEATPRIWSALSARLVDALTRHYKCVRPLGVSPQAIEYMRTSRASHPPARKPRRSAPRANPVYGRGAVALDKRARIGCAYVL